MVGNGAGMGLGFGFRGGCDAGFGDGVMGFSCEMGGYFGSYGRWFFLTKNGAIS